MTSSLVGSEMCIRDSATTAAPPQPPQAVASKASLPASPKTEGAHATPVSYTHLTLPTICSV
eukprot:8905485-Prorocentrum_lima.AAC.1